MGQGPHQPFTTDYDRSGTVQRRGVRAASVENAQKIAKGPVWKSSPLYSQVFTVTKEGAASSTAIEQNLTE
ncbi:MAG: hypothetical protein LBD67_07215 [Candidatus Accumulibacter sp.]|jgi:hypothetical protein|nr:hypothetical protein [Accumulibacter sp.]